MKYSDRGATIDVYIEITECLLMKATGDAGSFLPPLNDNDEEEEEKVCTPSSKPGNVRFTRSVKGNKSLTGSSGGPSPSLADSPKYSRKTSNLMMLLDDTLPAEMRRPTTTMLMVRVVDSGIGLSGSFYVPVLLLS